MDNQQQQQYQPSQQEQEQYSAYPETHQTLTGVVNYQGVVAGLSGWNDPPKFTKDDEILNQTKDPEILISSTIKNILLNLKNLQIQNRVLQDTEKRLNILFDKLDTNVIENSILGLLVHLTNSLDSKEYQKASGLVMELMQKGSANDSKWVVGLKRLVEILANS